MWKIVTIDSTPKTFRFLIYGMITIILGSITIKVVDNFFFGGKPVSFNGGEIGFANSNAVTFGHLASLNTLVEWQPCLEATLEIAEKLEYLDNVGSTMEIVAGRVGNDLFHLICLEQHFKLIGTGSDRARIEAITVRLWKDIDEAFVLRGISESN